MIVMLSKHFCTQTTPANTQHLQGLLHLVPHNNNNNNNSNSLQLCAYDYYASTYACSYKCALSCFSSIRYVVLHLALCAYAHPCHPHLTQNCPPARFALLMAGAALLYFSTLPAVRRMLHRLINPVVPAPGAPAHPPHPGPAAAGGVAAPAPVVGGAAVGGQDGVRAPAGLLHEIRALVVGFFTSLLPGW